jgi:large subunit ribosomal protein L3
MKVLIGKKIGMTQVYKEDGKAIPTTILDVSENFVSRTLKNGEGEEVSHIEVGKDKKKKTVKSDEGNYKELGHVPAHKKVFIAGKVENIDEIKVGSVLKLETFQEGELVHASNYTKGKGFQGVIKRWRFAGGPRTHGASDRERAPGSLGSRTIPGRVFKGKKMGGHMGTRMKTIKNLKVSFIDNENKLIGLAGAVTGPKGTYVIIRSRK